MALRTAREFMIDAGRRFENIGALEAETSWVYGPGIPQQRAAIAIRGVMPLARTRGIGRYERARRRL